MHTVYLVIVMLAVVRAQRNDALVPGTTKQHDKWTMISHYLFDAGEYHKHNDNSMYMHVGIAEHLHGLVSDEVRAFAVANHTRLPISARDYARVAREVPWLRVIIQAVSQSHRVQVSKSGYTEVFEAPVPMRFEVAHMFTDHFLQLLVRLHHREIECRRQSGLTVPSRRQIAACAAKVLLRPPSGLAEETREAVQAGVDADKYLMYAYDITPPRV